MRSREEERRQEELVESRAKVENRIVEEKKVARVLAARDLRLAAIERGEPLPAPEYLPGPVTGRNFKLWSLVAFDFFIGDGRDYALCNISFDQHVSGTLYLDSNNGGDIEPFKSPERFMEPFPLYIERDENVFVDFQCTLIDEDHLVLHVPLELWSKREKSAPPIPEVVPKVIELFGIRDRKWDEMMMASRQARLAQPARKNKKRSIRNRRRLAAQPAP
ncbi:hypothetical protein PG984_011958 [Apiospora sp. TS-2023a]